MLEQGYHASLKHGQQKQPPSNAVVELAGLGLGSVTSYSPANKRQR